VLLVESKKASIVEKLGCHKRAERLLLRRTAQRAAAVHEPVPGTSRHFSAVPKFRRYGR
jgi:hypothetical protein